MGLFLPLFPQGHLENSASYLHFPKQGGKPPVQGGKEQFWQSVLRLLSSMVQMVNVTKLGITDVFLPPLVHILSQHPP